MRRNISLPAFSLSFWLLVHPVSGRASSLKLDEEIVFFPTAAALATDGTKWLVPVHGWVFEREPDSPLRNALLAALRRNLGLETEGPGDDLFRARARLFVADSEGGKEITVRLNDREFSGPPSGDDGHFWCEFGVPREQGRPGEWVSYTACLPATDRRTYAGRALLVPDGAPMVISDIDDTVKVTEGWRKEARIANTFARPFEAVAGMAEVYREWAAKGAVFHYVSGSPWQLYPSFAEGFDRAGLPTGAFHLRPLRLADPSCLAFFSSPREYKVETISAIIQGFPRSVFVLVGDSGEQDPEAYGEIGRMYPERVGAIFIRDVSVGESQAGRFEKAFRGLPPSRWHVFKSAEDLRHLPSYF